MFIAELSIHKLSFLSFANMTSCISNFFIDKLKGMCHILKNSYQPETLRILVESCKNV